MNKKKNTPNRTRKLLILLIVALAAILVAVLVFLGIKIFSKPAPKVSITEDFSHSVPKDLQENETVTLTSQEGFLEILTVAGAYSEVAEPLYYYDENGDAVGQYVYDEFDWVYGWQDDEGKITELPEDEQFESPYALVGGEPLLMTGDVSLHFMVYTQEGQPVTTYMYFVLSNAADMSVFSKAMLRANFGEVKAVSDNVAELVVDADTISEEMLQLNSEYELADYLAYLNRMYGVTEN